MIVIKCLIGLVVEVIYIELVVVVLFLVLVGLDLLEQQVLLIPLDGLLVVVFVPLLLMML
jgi:hypothetical protein